MTTFDNAFIKKLGTALPIQKSGNKPKDFSNTTYSKTKKIKKIVEASPDLDDIKDVKDYIFNT
jgi:hypothetical protein